MQIDISFPFLNLSEVSKDTDKMRGGIYSSFMTVYLKYSCNSYVELQQSVNLSYIKCYLNYYFAKDIKILTLTFIIIKTPEI